MEKPIKSKILLSNIERSCIPYLERIHVSGGVATTTDMDFWVSCPTTLKDGYYYPRGISAGLYINDKDLLLDQFPTCEVEENFSMTLDAQGVAALAFVSKAQSFEETRYYLNGVFLNGRHMVATDGHRMHLVDFVCDLKESVILPRKAIKLILTIFKEQKANCVSLSFSANKFRAQIGGCCVYGKLIDGSFPDYTRVIPKEFEKTGNIDISEFVKIAPQVKAISAINGIKKSAAVKICDGKIEVSGDYIKTGIFWETTLDIKAGYNISYLTQLCSGVYEYKDAESPLLIRGNEFSGQVSILMPLGVF